MRRWSDTMEKLMEKEERPSLLSIFNSFAPNKLMPAKKAKCVSLSISSIVNLYLPIYFTKNGPTPDSFCLFSFFPNTIWQKNCSLQRYSNSDHQSRRRARWLPPPPRQLDHHHHHHDNLTTTTTTTNLSLLIVFLCKLVFLSFIISAPFESHFKVVSKIKFRNSQ